MWRACYLPMLLVVAVCATTVQAHAWRAAEEVQ